MKFSKFAQPMVTVSFTSVVQEQSLKHFRLLNRCWPQCCTQALHGWQLLGRFYQLKSSRHSILWLHLVISRMQVTVKRYQPRLQKLKERNNRFLVRRLFIIWKQHDCLNLRTLYRILQIVRLPILNLVRYSFDNLFVNASKAKPWPMI